MASSSSRKSNSSASKQKPTFRRSTGGASARSSSAKRPVSAAKPSTYTTPAPKKTPARTYVAPTKRAAVKSVSTARAARVKQPQIRPKATASVPSKSAVPAQTPTKRKAAAATRRTTARPVVSTQKASSVAGALKSTAPAKRSRSKAVQPKQAKAAIKAPAAPAPVKKKAIAPVRAKAPASHKLTLPFAAQGRALSGIGTAAKAKVAGLPVGTAKAAGKAKAPVPAKPARTLSTKASLPRIIVAAALALVLVVGLGAAVVINSGFFAVTNVIVNGSAHVPQQTVEQLVSVPESATLFNVSDEDIAEPLLQNPWVSGVTIEREFPHTIVITPVERTVEAILYISADDVAWAISDDSRWIAPVSLAATADAAGNVTAAPAATADDAAGEGDEYTEDGDYTDEGEDPIGQDETASGNHSSNQASIDAAVALARQAGGVLLTDVGTDVSPVSGQEVTDEVVLAGLAYATGFTDDFLAQIKDISIPSVEAISCDLESGVEVSLGRPEDIQQKEAVVRKLLEQEQGVTYINVRVADAYSFRSASV